MRQRDTGAGKVILVLDGNENQAVAATRSLGRAGYRVLVGAPERWSKAGWSNQASGSFCYPSPSVDPAAFVEAIAARCRDSGAEVLLPMTERTTLPLSAHRAVFEGLSAGLVLPDHRTVLSAFDKHQMTSLARDIGLPVPRTHLLTRPSSPEEVLDLLAFPLVLKPRQSEARSADGRLLPTGAPRYARDTVEFHAAVQELRTRCDDILVQEYVPGQGAGYFALVRHGDLRAEFAHRRVRDVRPTGSGSAVRASVWPDPRLREASLALLRTIAWHGVAMVEFRIRPDGTPVFMEVNTRFWNSLALAVHAGVDFPSLVVEMALHGDVSPVGAYRTDVHCRWLLGDVRHLLAVLRGPPAGYPGEFPTRLRTLAHFLRSTPGMHHDNFEWRDPLPELGDWLNLLLHRLPRDWRRRSR